MAKAKTIANTDLEKQLQQLRKDIAALSETVSGLAAQDLRQGRDHSGRLASDIGDRGRRVMEMASDRAVDVERRAIGYVRRNPLQSMAVAAAAGVVAGWLSRDR